MRKMWLILLLLSCLAFTGCGNNTSETASSNMESVDNNADVEDEAVVEESVVVMHKLYFDVEVIAPEDVLTGHSIELYMDEQMVHKFEDNKYYTELIDAEEGNHVLSFKVDNEVVSENNQNIELNEDMSVSFVLGYGETLDITSYETVNSIADSAIVYEDMVNVSLDKAMEELSNKHFVNVRYESNDESSILETSDWIVVSQNVSPGIELDKAEEIVLTCRKIYFQLYFDLTFDQNLLLATYDIDVYLDGEKIDTIPHGKNFTYMTKLKEGEHSAIFYKNTDNSVYSEKKLDIKTDSTLTGNLHSNNKDIELNDFVLKDGIENTSFEVVNVTGMRLDKALELLGSIGFTNVVKEPAGDIWVDYNWIVSSQSVAAGSTVDKNTKIVLNSVKKEEYLSSNYLSLNISEAAKKAEENGNEILYVDYAQNMYMTNRISSMDDNEKKLWVVKQATFNDEGKIQLYFIYTGKVEMPDVVSANLVDALATLKKAGFSSIENKAEDDGFIWDNADWKVTAQSVQAGTSINANETITLTVANINTTSTSQQTNNTQTDTEEKKAEETEEENILTKDNCEELAELLSAKVVDPDKQSKFVYNHTGDIIEFDAIVADLQQKEGTKTYYSYTFVPGEDIDHVGAALFTTDYIQWRHFNWENSPGELRITSKIRIRAKVLGGSSYIEIEPVKTWGR